MKSTFKRRGLWWTSMGFTKTHLIGVFVTESLLGTAGVGLAVAAFSTTARSIEFLLAAICCLLLQIGVLLSSIVSLLFYLGSTVEEQSERFDERQIVEERRSNDSKATPIPCPD